MEADHIFIFSERNGSEADELVDFGLTEGSSRAHPGQGTINRKFYFENFFLEILWMNNESEIKSDLIQPTKLWERANFKNYKTSPFGLCLVSTPDTNDLFANCLKYQPKYLPGGLMIDILTNENNSELPWTFRLPFISEKPTKGEPIDHIVKLKQLTKVTFGIAGNSHTSKFTEFVSQASNIAFSAAEKHTLVLEFDYGKQGQSKHFKGLPLLIEY